MMGMNSIWLSDQMMSDKRTVAPITVPRPTAMPLAKRNNRMRGTDW